MFIPERVVVTETLCSEEEYILGNTPMMDEYFVEQHPIDR